MAYRNIEDQRAASKKHYYLNKKTYLERNKRYRSEIRKFVQSVKESAPCADCGKGYPYYIMDFDHLRDKDFNINYLSSTGRIGSLKKEIKKCDIVCANCHRERTYKRTCSSSSVD